VTWSIFLILIQDGVINGSIYALLALSLVLVFTVTRVIFLPEGEFVAYGALTFVALAAGKVPGTLWLMVGLGVGAAAAGLWSDRHQITPRLVAGLVVETLVVPAAVAALVLWLAPLKPGIGIEVLLALAIIVPMGPYIYRLAFRPLANTSVLVLLIAAIGVHLAMTGLGLVFFGAEGSRATTLSTGSFRAGPLMVNAQSLWIIGLTVALIAALYLFFSRTLMGKALRATAVNRLGAQLVGIPPALSGRVAFSVAAFIGALCGILVSPLTTMYYDSGFIVGLKGFTAAIIAGLVSYPGAAVAALFIGVVESLSSFWASAFKEVIVFMVIIPVLLLRSLRSAAVEEEEE
jgi:branched-chain amino acid transport system permease protein